MNSVTIIKALSDYNRLRVMWLLSVKNELCVCQITDVLKLATATVSKHMSILNNAGLVSSRKESRWVYYSLGEDFSQEDIKNFIEWSKKGYEKQIIIDLEYSKNCKPQS